MWERGGLHRTERIRPINFPSLSIRAFCFSFRKKERSWWQVGTIDRSSGWQQKANSLPW